MRILFIQTGGTIDKDYPRKVGGYLFEISEAAAKRILSRANPGFEYEFVTLMRKDSLDMTLEDRRKIVEYCQNSPAKKILITHGTDTMAETAKLLTNSVRDKAVVLTGAIRPERFYDSDSDFNLGTALGALNVLDKGVYVAMNGVLFPGDKCMKDRETGKFVER
jgi:L-asparaginase